MRATVARNRKESQENHWSSWKHLVHLYARANRFLMASSRGKTPTTVSSIPLKDQNLLNEVGRGKFPVAILNIHSQIKLKSPKRQFK
jgi:hypothetical protein